MIEPFLLDTSGDNLCSDEAQMKKRRHRMITLYLVFKLTGLLTRMCLWLVLLPFKIVFLPFRLLFGRPGRRTGDSDDGFWNGLLIGSLFF